MVLAANKAKAIALMYVQVRVCAYRLYICADVCASMHMYIHTNARVCRAVWSGAGYAHLILQYRPGLPPLHGGKSSHGP